MLARWIAAALAAAPGLPAAADTLHVPGDFATIQAAIDAASSGDEIVVADGVYAGPGNKYLHFGGTAVHLRSANGPESCIIDCEHDGRAFFLQNDFFTPIFIEGFTCTNGNVGFDFPGSRKGGAVLLANSSPTFVNCIFDGNRGHEGGAVFSEGHSAEALFVNCRITNHVFNGDGTKDDIHVGGGALTRGCSTTVFVNCTVADNVLAPGNDHFGGGLYVHLDAEVFLDNCIFWSNEAPVPGDQVALLTGGSVTVRNCNIEGGEAEVFNDGTGTLTFLGGNIDDDPLFGPDYALGAGSPCIDAGDDLLVPADDTDLDGDGDTEEPLPLDLAGHPRFLDDAVDMGPLEFQGAPCNDVDGDGMVGVADLTAIILAWGTADPDADVTGDGDVGVDDLVAVITGWGACP